MYFAKSVVLFIKISKIFHLWQEVFILFLIFKFDLFWNVEVLAHNIPHFRTQSNLFCFSFSFLLGWMINKVVFGLFLWRWWVSSKKCIFWRWCCNCCVRNLSLLWHMHVFFLTTSSLDACILYCISNLYSSYKYLTSYTVCNRTVLVELRYVNQNAVVSKTHSLMIYLLLS